MTSKRVRFLRQVADIKSRSIPHAIMKLDSKWWDIRNWPISKRLDEELRPKQEEELGI